MELKLPGPPQLKLKFSQLNDPADYGFVIFRADFYTENRSNPVQFLARAARPKGRQTWA
jgi:hypothetical protein